jgi:AmiR/NasT family two-component response regulator
MLATNTALAWNLLRRDQQFRSALASRDIIGQAKGLVMERFGVDAVQAFELLRRLSQDSNTPVSGVAHRLVDDHEKRRGGG